MRYWIKNKILCVPLWKHIIIMAYSLRCLPECEKEYIQVRVRVKRRVCFHSTRDLNRKPNLWEQRVDIVCHFDIVQLKNQLNISAKVQSHQVWRFSNLCNEISKEHIFCWFSFGLFSSNNVLLFLPFKGRFYTWNSEKNM